MLEARCISAYSSVWAVIMVRVRGISRKGWQMPKSSETLRRRPKLNKTDIAYAAAIMDGEGWISGSQFVGSGKDPDLNIGVCNCSPDLMDWFKERFGGIVRERNWKSSRLSKRVNFEWRPCTEDIAWFLKLVMPFMIIKRRQARLAIIYRSLIGLKSGAEKKRRIVTLIQKANRA